MTLEETTQLYASVLRQLLPVGGYDTSPNTEALAVDVYAHAKLLAQADLDGKRLLSVLEGFPPDLINEYELEYGLPLKCSINAGRTIEERIELLKWVRSTRNVLNKAYLEQILAIFGVILIDVVKFKPMQCTAPCNAPVNTERLRYKVFLRLQYPVNADMGCIIENYLPGYLRIDWTIDMPWGVWILNADVTVNTSGIAHYTAYKTNQREYYDSFANLDLTNAIIRSLHDSDMQQWQAVKDACNELTGVTDWSFDLANNQIKYILSIEYFDPHYQWVWNNILYNSADTACKAFWSSQGSGWSFSHVSDPDRPYPGCIGYNAEQNRYDGYQPVQRVARVDPVPEPVEKTLIFGTVAQKIISNTSSSNQAISLLAEAYLENVAKSIFNTEESKQFVKLSDLLFQLELNKTLRKLKELS